MSDECPRAGRMFGCKFEARYERRIPPGIAERVTKISAGTFEDAFGVNVYIRDICVRCGKTIERN